MAKRAVQQTRSVIDPMFHIPEGVQELYYDESQTTDELVVEELAEDADITDESDDIDYSEQPETPQILGILPPQVVRMDAAGNEVVDIVLEVDDVFNATKYEFRVTKT